MRKGQGLWRQQRRERPAAAAATTLDLASSRTEREEGEGPARLALEGR
jgi:hypothetical protein